MIPYGVGEVPRSALRLFGWARTHALDNAYAATQALAIQISERQALQPSGVDGPGELTRLAPEQCRELLATRRFGRLAYLARAGVPDIVPVNYALDGEDILIRSGPGPKLQAAERKELVAFEVDDLDEDTHTGWSVTVVGRATRLLPADRERVTATPSPWAAGPRLHLLRITPVRLDGRRLT